MLSMESKWASFGWWLLELLLIGSFPGKNNIVANYTISFIKMKNFQLASAM